MIILGHCPSADNPRTPVNESDCFNKTAPYSKQKGHTGNLCQVDCANLGVCDHDTGICKCFKGFYGANCAMYEGYFFNDTKNEKIIPVELTTDDYYEL